MWSARFLKKLVMRRWESKDLCKRTQQPQHCWELSANNVASVWTGLKTRCDKVQIAPWEIQETSLAFVHIKRSFCIPACTANLYFHSYLHWNKWKSPLHFKTSSQKTPKLAHNFPYHYLCHSYAAKTRLLSVRTALRSDGHPGTFKCERASPMQNLSFQSQHASTESQDKRHQSKSRTYVSLESLRISSINYTTCTLGEKIYTVERGKMQADRLREHLSHQNPLRASSLSPVIAPVPDDFGT